MATSSEEGRVGTVEIGGSLLEAMLSEKYVLSLVDSLSRGVKDAQSRRLAAVIGMWNGCYWAGLEGG